jgi:ParB/RepB/Spo0J family partition protein
MSVDKLQDAEEDVAQLREEEARAERDARAADLRRPPVADTAGKPHRTVTLALTAVRPMANMRTGPLADIHELAVSIRETGLLHPPLVRATGEDEQPYELLAGQRRFAAMALVDEAEGAREDWRFTVVDGISRREALTMQFAENFHQSKPEPVQFARAARRIMAEDPSLTAAEVSRLVGAPAAWTRRALRLLELPDAIVDRVEQGDLSFTNADLVRRGIARGDVSAGEASDLVEQHAGGVLSGAELKHGVGYVPPPPAGYDELSRGLDEARFRPPRDPDDRNDDPEQRDWESSADPSGPVRVERRDRGPQSEEQRLREADLDGYLLGMVLFRAASDRRRSVLRIASQEDAHRYAFSLRPAERLSALRSLAAEVLAADPDPPHALRDVAGVRG